MRATPVAFTVLPLVALLAAGLAAGAVEPTPRIVLTPDPVPAETPLDVTLVDVPDPDGVANASLQTCLSEKGQARFCLVPVEMRRVNGTFVGRSANGFPNGEEIGVKVTLHYHDGSKLDVPSGIADPERAYAFFTVGTPVGERATPAPAGAAPLAALLAAAALGVALAARRHA